MLHQAIRNLDTRIVNLSTTAEDIVDFADDGNGNILVVNVTEAAIATEMSRLQAEYDAQQYARDRQYPAIGDQLDALFHAGVFPAEMAAEIQAVKDKYPK